MDQPASQRKDRRVWSCVLADEKENLTSAATLPSSYSKSSNRKVEGTQARSERKTACKYTHQDRKRLDNAIYDALQSELLSRSRNGKTKPNQITTEKNNNSSVEMIQSGHRYSMASNPPSSHCNTDKEPLQIKCRQKSKSSIYCDRASDEIIIAPKMNEDSNEDYDVDFKIERIPRKLQDHASGMIEQADSVISLSDSDCEISKPKPVKKVRPLKQTSSAILSRNCFKIQDSNKQKSKHEKTKAKTSVRRRCKATAYVSDDDDILSTTANINVQINEDITAIDCLEMCPTCGEKIPISRMTSHASECNDVSELVTTSVVPPVTVSERKSDRHHAALRTRILPRSRTVKGSKERTALKKGPLVFDDWQNACGKLQGVQGTKKCHEDSNAADFAADCLSSRQLEVNLKLKNCAVAKNTATLAQGSTRNASSERNEKLGNPCRTNVPGGVTNDIADVIETVTSASNLSSISKSKKPRMQHRAESDRSDSDSNDSMVSDVINQYLDHATTDKPVPLQRENIGSPSDRETCFICGKEFPSGKIYRKHVENEVERMNSKVSPKVSKQTRSNIQYDEISEVNACEEVHDGATLAERLGNRKSWSAFQFNQKKLSNKSTIDKEELDNDLIITDDDISLSPIKSFKPIDEHSSFDFSNQFSNSHKTRKKSNQGKSKWHQGQRSRYKRTRKRK